MDRLEHHCHLFHLRFGDMAEDVAIKMYRAALPFSSLASLIVVEFRNVAYCPGEDATSLSLTRDLSYTDASQNLRGTLAEIKGNTMIALVSTECPVSMVEAVSKARMLKRQNNGSILLVAPLEKLSEQHISMSRMISGGNLFFIYDERWYQSFGDDQIRLPSKLYGEALLRKNN